MSLDVYLTSVLGATLCQCHCGHEHVKQSVEELYWSNITHNLNKMADEAGIYKALWRPDEVGITKASQLIEILETGLLDLKSRPAHFKQFNAKNGWGLYEHLVKFVEEYLYACKENPEANVSVSR